MAISAAVPPLVFRCSPGTVGVVAREPSLRLQGIAVMNRFGVAFDEKGFDLVIIVVSCGLCAAAIWVLFKSF